MDLLTYGTIPTPLGQLVVIASATGVVRCAFESEGIDQVVFSVRDKLASPVAEDPDALRPVFDQVEEYFAGQRTSFDVALDWSLSTGFYEKVRRHVATIPFGTVQTYGQVADEIGNPGASRAVGTACARNPLPVFVPCHRVVRADGQPGGYVGGLGNKRFLLALESRATGGSSHS